MRATGIPIYGLTPFRRGGRRAIIGGGTAGDRAEGSGLGQVVQGSSTEGGSGLVVAAAYGGAAAMGE